MLIPLSIETRIHLNNTFGFRCQVSGVSKLMTECEIR